MRWQTTEKTAAIPMRVIGPVRLISQEIDAEIGIPLATLEKPLWPSVHRGARACTAAGGIRALVVDERMSRSVLVEADSAVTLHRILGELKSDLGTLQSIVAQTSRFAKLIELNAEIIGSQLYLRLEFLTGDAAGHNMVTLAAERLLDWILQTYPVLKYVSLSGNYCSDKKTSAVNGILGRGKNVVAEVTLSRQLCHRFLKTTPEKLVDINVKKNLMGNIAAGGLRTANAHFANMLLAFYLATGQDAANIIEGSQGFVSAEVRDSGLYFAVTLPNIIVGAYGNGKDEPFVQENLALLGCHAPSDPGYNARRLAIVAAAAVLCGELSLLAALTNRGELMQSHLRLERSN